MRTHLEQTYGVTYKSDQSYYTLLAEAGITYKKTQRTNPQADPAAIAAKKK